MVNTNLSGTKTDLTDISKEPLSDRETRDTNKSGAVPDFTNVTKEQLVRDFKVVIADAEALLKATAHQGGEALAAVRARAEGSLARAKVKLGKAQDALTEKTRVAARSTDNFVHENPWRAVGMAAGAGVVVGLLIGRR